MNEKFSKKITETFGGGCGGGPVVVGVCGCDSLLCFFNSRKTFRSDCGSSIYFTGCGTVFWIRSASAFSVVVNVGC